MRVDESNVDQLGYWDGASGAYWAARAARFDEGVAAYQPHLLAAADIGPGDEVLDVGCGSGRTTRDAARLAVGGHALGVDLSTPMLALATELAAREGVGNVRFEQADAQVHPFPEAHFDVVVSRNGVLFFGDLPAAFANLARAMRPGGRLALMVWQAPERNEWTRALRSAFALGSSAPGVLTDQDRTRDLLRDFRDVAIEGHEEDMYFGADVDDAVDFVTGQFASAIAKLDDPDGAVEALRSDMAAHLTADGVRYGSAAWLVTARR